MTVGRLAVRSEKSGTNRCHRLIVRLPTSSAACELRRQSEITQIHGVHFPHRFRLKAGGVMGFAGLWSVWKVEGHKPLITCCVITVPATDLVQPFHDRMPAILTPEDYATWFDWDTPLPDLKALLKPYPVEAMEVQEASPLVNSPKNGGPECLGAA